jgi:hypothetical protein
MTVIADVFKELFSMFVGDALLTVAILALVAVIAFITKEVPPANPFLSGFALLGGCLTIIITITALHAKRAKQAKKSSI